MAFTEAEIAYLRSQPLARVAYGHAEPPIERVGMVGPGLYMRITPTVCWSWNLAGKPAGDTWYTPRRTVHQPPTGQT